MKRTLLATALTVSFGIGAYAQTAVVHEYYVVRDPATKKCTIVDKKPTSTTTTIVDDGLFKTSEEAETGMKTIKDTHED